MESLSKYQDVDSFWHDKPSKNGRPSSNNGFIYTSYAKHVTPESLHREKIYSRFMGCVESLDPLVVNRLPGIKHPVISKDEIIGMVSLGLLNLAPLENSHYNFCNIDSSFDRKLTISKFVKAAYQLYRIRKEHRNYFWENKMVDTYPLAFKLMPWDVYYIKRLHNYNATIIETLLFYFNFVFVLLKGGKSVRVLLWLQCQDLNHPLKRLIPTKKWVKDYFGEEHTLYKRF